VLTGALIMEVTRPFFEVNMKVQLSNNHKEKTTTED
jgi:hypothetical protein